MTGLPPLPAVLRQVSCSGDIAASYSLIDPQGMVMGRDPQCQILLDSESYGGVSRKHAEVRPSFTSPTGWQVCDLSSANGTYVNGQPLRGCRSLQVGDRISLAQGGPHFIFGLQSSTEFVELPTNRSLVSQNGSPENISALPVHSVVVSDVTFSQLFPILSTGRDLTQKAYLLPGIITIAFVVLMFTAIGKSDLFNLLLAAYIAGIAYFFVYQLCGKRKPWWVLAGSAIVTVLVLSSPLLDLFVFVFRDFLPGKVSQSAASENFLLMLVRMFFGAGLMEELLKAIPILLAYGIGTKLRSPWREKIGVWEPLDGILLGTASAVGFTLLETLGQYVPSASNDLMLQSQGAVVGLQLLITRILGSISGHMAYSGYLGYFIGLSVLKPSKRWQILGVGYLTAAGLHALWNATGALNLLVLALVGIASYAFLAAAILKARALSPNRSQNFATRFTNLP
ncbi:MAG: PrsW family intramembrane metalloprotease [Timaviella obliquedivisa GSE-PSE-MK23-08B]|jgi:RsiW-degrading membrane proteinase PrsW (M82 family)|nr:PrsW family intramembrane metalloprotease [Timaviella obliquedivisa GSE-PSE-MK23-08B]